MQLRRNPKDRGLIPSLCSLARVLGVSRQTVNDSLRERRSVSPEMALRLPRLFGNSPEVRLSARSTCGTPCRSLAPTWRASSR